jgi:hypothetical protein
VTTSDDDKFLVIDGRKWRRSDPAIPAAFRQELVDELMSARRAVAAARRSDDPQAEKAARARVQDAKVALGERGAKWWEPASEAQQRTRAASAMRALLWHRGDNKTICPSDVARTVFGSSWRAQMDLVRSVATELAEAGKVELRQKGKVVDGATARGPLRIALSSP